MKKLKYLDYFCISFIPIVSSSRFVDVQGYPPGIAKHIEILKEWSFFIIIVLAIVGLFVKIIQDTLGASRKEIKAVLDVLNEKFFVHIPKIERHKNRVTLFRACKNPLTHAIRLKIFSRAGKNYQNSKTSFRLDDDHSGENEGIAGKAWHGSCTTTVTELPEWPEEENAETENIRREYAEKSGLTLEKAKEIGVKCRSITATIVRNREGQDWGVLVLDSRDPKGIDDNSEKQLLIDTVADLLSFYVR